MKSFAVIVPVGPGTDELRRFHDLIDSLWSYEPAARMCVAIDSSTQARRLAPRGKQEEAFSGSPPETNRTRHGGAS